MSKKFSYLDQLHAFFEWSDMNPLPPYSKLLWFILMQINNKARWMEWFPVDINRLKYMTQIKSTDTLVRNRNKLIQAGLIEYKQGRKGYPSQYRIVPFRRQPDGIYLPESINVSMKEDSVSKRFPESKPEPISESILETISEPISERNSEKSYISDDIKKKSEPISEPISERKEVSTLNNYIKTKTKTKTKTDIHTGKKAKKEKINFTGLMDFWNSHRRNMAKVIKMTETRKKRVNNLLKDWSKEDIETVIFKAEASNFMNGGKDGSGWKASFDWVMEPKNFVKVLEGNYDNRPGSASEPFQSYESGADYIKLLAQGKIDVNGEPINEQAGDWQTDQPDADIISGVIFQIDS